MGVPQSDANPESEVELRIVQPGEQLTAASQEALERRTDKEHQAAIDRAFLAFQSVGDLKAYISEQADG